MIKNIYVKWEELLKKANNDATSVLEYYLSKKANNKVYFGVDNTLTKKIYIEFDKGRLDNYDAPEISGMKISRVKASYIDQSKDYLCIANDSDFDEVFLAFISTLVDKLVDSKSNDKTIQDIEETIKFYKDYFSNPNKSLSDSEEQGLCGELLYLAKLITENGEGSVVNWLGPNKNKRDFVFDNKAVEIKSTLNQTETSITISNENQLDSSNLDELRLVVYILEKNPNGDIDVVSCAKNVLALMKDVQSIKIFKSKLIMMGINVDLYKIRNKYTIEQTKSYIISDDFPCLTKNNIPNVVFNVKYKINLNSLDKYMCGDANE